MSPSVVGGSSHNRAASINGATLGNAMGSKINGTNGSGGGGRMYPHLEDLLSVTPDVDIKQTLRSILLNADTLAKQADTHLDFRRPDFALQEYIKASIIAIDIIPRHKDYVDMQSSKGEAYRLYLGLNKRINSQHQKFADVKAMIKEDNQRSGVQPARSQLKTFASSPQPVNGHTRAQSVQNQPLSTLSNGNNVKPKPPIQPKPNALHGNVLTSSSQGSDLATRFASLRSGTNGAVQDPRIRTQSIPGIGDGALSKVTQAPLNRLVGPRDMPSAPTSLPGASKLPPLDVQVPNLPRAPDAIYSPAQNADTPATANLLSSVQRVGSFSSTARNTAAPPISNHIPTPRIQENGHDYFASIPSVPPKKVMPSIPDSATVSAEDLTEYLKYGSPTFKVLLVDVRNREDFESGHILWQSIICVEPLTLREGVSAEQLGESMIIAPDSEKALYEQRHEYDLVVFYDQSSTSLKGTDRAVVQFSKAIYDYEYDQPLKRRPMMLIGGLDAWTDVLGPNCLQASISRTSSPAPDGFGKPGRPLGRFPAARKPAGPQLRRKKTYSSRPLSKEEENKWDELLRKDSVSFSKTIKEEEEAAELVYAKTTEDFFRRYPELPAIQESMVTPLPREKSFTSVAPAPEIPSQPARPAPALPRQYSSGLFEKGPVAVASPSHVAITKSRRPHGLTGLNNSGVTCYLNSAVQAISATPFLRETLMQFSQSRSPVPRKNDEDPTVQPPQFLTRSLQNLLNHLWSGNQDFLKPTSFADYVNRVHSGKVTDQRVRALAYGGHGRQHDSAEFLNFLLEILDDELNPKRNLPEPKTDDPRYEQTLNSQPFTISADLAWKYLTAREASPITQKLKGLVGHIAMCTGCRFESKTFELFTYLNLTIPDDRKPYTITNLIRENFGREETISDYACDNCKERHNCIRKDVLCYLPDYLIIELNRYNTAQVKLHNPVTFPERGLELPAASCSLSTSPDADRRRRGPFSYDVYGVTMHVGDSIGKGHYYTLARSLDKPNVGGSAGKWHEFNDVHVMPREFAATQGRLATVLFMKRAGVP